MGAAAETGVVQGFVQPRSVGGDPEQAAEEFVELQSRRTRRAMDAKNEAEASRGCTPSL
jgi:hypothetical protein